jgi:hypothetical protein
VSAPKKERTAITAAFFRIVADFDTYQHRYDPLMMMIHGTTTTATTTKAGLLQDQTIQQNKMRTRVV